MAEHSIIESFTADDLRLLAEHVVGQIEQDDHLSERVAGTILRTLARNPELGSMLVDSIEDRFPQSVLSDTAIKDGLDKGYVIIDPTNHDWIKTSSVDVSVGEYFWTTRRDHPGPRVFNPHNPNHIRSLWQGPKVAKTIREELMHGDFKNDLREEDFEGLDPDDRVIILAPNETVLAHTDQFIGGRSVEKDGKKYAATSMMKARSSWGRAFLSVCKDAGWGDVDYFNRWTMEIQNGLQEAWSVIPIHQPIAQMVFFRVVPIEASGYTGTGNYQQTTDLEQLKKSWRPEMMLPKLTKKGSYLGNGKR